MKAYWTSLVFLVACGGGNGGGNPADSAKAIDSSGSGSADAQVFLDAPPNVPAMIHISGQATERSLQGTTPVAGVLVEAYKASDENTVVAMATTDAQGNYMITINTNNMPVDGFLKATKGTTYVTTYLYPPAPLAADFTMGSINLLTSGNEGLASGTLCNADGGAGQNATLGAIGLLVLDNANMPVGGATVTTNPAAGTYCYDSGGLPNRNATATATDGIALAWNVPVGTASLSASKTGSVFKTHSVKSRANAIVTTVIVAQ